MYSAQAKDRFTQVPFARFLGAELVEVEHERAVVALPFQEENANPGGTLNGGATASLILLAGTLAAWTGIDLQTNPFLSTVDLALQYLSAAINEDVVAEARVLRRGRDLFFLDVMVQTPAGKPISKGLMMYRAPHYGGQPIRRHEKPVLLPPPTPLLPPYPLPEKGKYLQKLQVQEVHRSPGRVRLTMPCTPDHCDEQGRVHEGAIASLMDIAGTVASWTIPQRLNSRGATVGMMLSFCGSAQEEVTADACLQQRSEEMFFNTVQITTTATGRLVAMGNVSYRLLEAR